MTTAPLTAPARAFAHKTVFLTGATGFLGKAIMNSPIFDRLRRDYGSTEAANAFLRSKLCAVAGDVASPQLGLSTEDQQLLQQSVQIVIHSAAIVQLNPRLDVVFNMNCVGAMHMLDFAHSCPLIKCYMHVSTAFVNSNFAEVGKTTVHEELYPLHFDAAEAFLALRKATPDDVDRLTLQLMRSYPNTYTLTKSMAEHLLAMYARSTLPVVIFRPTIIGASTLTIFPGRPEYVVDVVPVDLAVNTALVSIAAVVSGVQKRTQHSPLVVHAGTSDVNPFHWELAGRLVPPYFRQNPSKQSPLSPKFRMIKTRTQFKTEWFLKYTVPVSLYGTFAKLSLSERRKDKALKFRKLKGRAKRLIGVFESYATEQWIFQTTESRAILQAYAAGSESEWWLDATTIDWDRYVTDFCIGLKKYILHEDVEGESALSA